MKQLNVIGQTISKTHLKIEKYNDGDGIFVKNLITNEVIEIRFYGIDAPELTPCKKLKQDELETSVSGRLLIELGYKSLEFLIYKNIHLSLPISFICLLLLIIILKKNGTNYFKNF